SAKVVLGRSVVYTLALDRPIDMIPDIWPWARRLIHRKKPMIRAPYSRKGSNDAKRLLVVLTNLRSLTLSFRSVTWVSGRGCGPLAVNLWPVRSVYVMWPLSLLTVADATWPALAAAWKSVYDFAVLPAPPAALDSRKATTMSAPSTMATHRQLRSGPDGVGGRSER